MYVEIYIMVHSSLAKMINLKTHINISWNPFSVCWNRIGLNVFRKKESLTSISLVDYMHCSAVFLTCFDSFWRVSTYCTAQPILCIHAQSKFPVLHKKVWATFESSFFHIFGVILFYFLNTIAFAQKMLHYDFEWFFSNFFDFLGEENCFFRATHIFIFKCECAR